MKREVLITVKTYPSISTKYEEIVCTAGIDLSSSPHRFIRIYPVPFRNLPYEKRYKKYEIWCFDVEKSQKDHRIDSFHLANPNKGGEKIGHIGTENNWKRRKEIVLPLLAPSMCILQENYENAPKDSPTLGLVRPRNVKFIVEPDEREWDEKRKAIISQYGLFDTKGKKPLEKVPFKFSYRFTCDHPKCNGHKMLVTDWEAYQLWRNCRDRALEKGRNQTEAEEEAVDKVIEKYQHYMLTKRDLYFYVGTVHKYGTWIIVGLFYPPLINGSHESQNLSQ